MVDAFICAYVRTPIRRFGGSLATLRADDLGAVPMKALLASHPSLDPEAIDEVVLGCANQAGEDNRNVARMSALLAGLPVSVPGTTMNRLCGSGMDAVITAARAIRAREVELVIAGGVESMSRAPFVMPKADAAFSRQAEIHDIMIGWRFINPLMKQQYGVDSMPETVENVAQEHKVSRADQDAFALCSQAKASAAQASGRLAREITPVSVAQRKGDPLVVGRDQHPRAATIEALAKLKPIVWPDGTVTAGNASGVSDGAAALIIATEAAAKRHGLAPLVRILGGATAGVAPRVMGVGPMPATRKLLDRLGLRQEQLAVVELNEAFASQGLAVLRDLGIADDDPRVNRNGGAVALGHPLGMSGARISGTAALELAETGGPLCPRHHLHRRRPGNSGRAREGLIRGFTGSALRRPNCTPQRSCGQDSRPFSDGRLSCHAARLTACPGRLGKGWLARKGHLAPLRPSRADGSGLPCGASARANPPSQGRLRGRSIPLDKTGFIFENGDK